MGPPCPGEEWWRVARRKGHNAESYSGPAGGPERRVQVFSALVALSAGGRRVRRRGGGGAGSALRQSGRGFRPRRERAWGPSHSCDSQSGVGFFLSSSYTGLGVS